MTEQANPELELTLLRQRADTMGVKYHPNAKLETLRQKVQDHLDGLDAKSADTDSTDEPAEPKAETEQQIRDRVRAEALRLVRCRIYNLNPEKRDLRGEIITVANKYIGSVSKLIPFGEATDGGYHIPNVLYQNLLGRRFQSVTTKMVKGQIEVVRRMVPEYNVELLPQLTQDELEELALQQNAAERMGS